jgi:hypothetical protein
MVAIAPANSAFASNIFKSSSVSAIISFAHKVFTESPVSFFTFDGSIYNHLVTVCQFLLIRLVVKTKHVKKLIIITLPYFSRQCMHGLAPTIAVNKKTSPLSYIP